MKSKISAFTLVELSIVLVILGLLVGGVLSGKSLIHAAQLRSITTQRDQFKTAMLTFQEQYSFLPGDLPTAYSYWGGHTNYAGCQTNDTNNATGCNGNGDGLISGDGSSGENMKFWMHLSLAGLIEGSYSGGTDDGNVFGINTPKSKYENNNTWDVLSADQLHKAIDYSTPINPNDPGGVYLILGSNFFDIYMRGSTLTNGDAWSIDKKVDDGMAMTGDITGSWGDGAMYTTGTDSYSISHYGPNLSYYQGNGYFDLKIGR